jgi:prepilin-type N-terminal cleavage/methylation domain-containing protein
MMFSFLHSDTRSKRRHRSGFTLPELLVVIAIIGILSSAMMAGMASVTAKAKEDRTRALIARIHSLLMEKWQGFETRRLPVPPGMSPAIASETRLAMIRELIRLELPDRMTDVESPPPAQPTALPIAPSLYSAYRRKAASIWGNNWDDESRHSQHIASGAPENWTYQHQGAECLFLILSKLTIGDSPALEMFKDSEIGDVDGDGMREILDAWGTPVRMLRWPAGFTGSPIQSADPQPDPFDPLRIDSRHGGVGTDDPFLMLPLIVSAGPDKVFDIAFDYTSAANYWDADWTSRVTSTNYPNDPYNDFGYGRLLGSVVDENSDGTDNSLDNIHNHLIATN